MTSEHTANNQLWREVRCPDRERELILVTLARAKNVPATKPPRTRSVVALQCSEETLRELVERAEDVGMCFDCQKYRALAALLEVCGAPLDVRMAARIGVVEARVRMNPKTADLYARATGRLLKERFAEPDGNAGNRGTARQKGAGGA